jgi:hypothetical protein
MIHRFAPIPLAAALLLGACDRAADGPAATPEPSLAALQGDPGARSARAHDTQPVVYHVRSEEDPAFPPDEAVCAAAPFAVNVRLGASLWAEATDAARGQVRATTRRVGARHRLRPHHGPDLRARRSAAVLRPLRAPGRRRHRRGGVLHRQQRRALAGTGAGRVLPARHRGAVRLRGRRRDQPERLQPGGSPRLHHRVQVDGAALSHTALNHGGGRGRGSPTAAPTSAAPSHGRPGHGTHGGHACLRGPLTNDDACGIFIVF